MTSMTETEPRAEYIAGLRALADVLEANPDLTLPASGSSPFGNTLSWVTSWVDDPKAATRDIIRSVGGKWDKRPGGSGDNLMVFGTAIHGLYVDIICNREAVCERVVTGTREVTKTVPAPDAPMVEVTETVEDVEWVCSPLLADAGLPPVERES